MRFWGMRPTKSEGLKLPVPTFSGPEFRRPLEVVKLLDCFQPLNGCLNIATCLNPFLTLFFFFKSSKFRPFGGKLSTPSLMINMRRQKLHMQHCYLAETHIYVFTTQNSFHSCILDWGWDIQKVIISWVKKLAALFFLPSSATWGHKRRSKDYSFFIILNPILQWKWTFFLLNPLIWLLLLESYFMAHKKLEKLGCFPFYWGVRFVQEKDGARVC